MTLQQLRYALAVLKAGSISKAASACRISQPTLTQQLRKLEDELGGALFERDRHPLVPTARGRALLAQAERVQAEAGRLEALAHEGEGSLAGPLRLGVIPSVAGSLLPRLLPPFLRAHPEVQLTVSEAQTRNLVQAVLAGELDAGIAAVPLDERGLQLTPLYREGFVAFLPPRHALLKQKALKPSDLKDQRLLLMGEGHCFRNQALSLCRASAEDALFIESGSFKTLVDLVQQGLGLSILPALTAQDLPREQRKRVRAFSGDAPVRQVALLQAKQALRGRAAMELVKLVQQAVPAGPSGRVLDPGIVLSS